MAKKPTIERDNEPIDKGMQEGGQKPDIAASGSDAAPDDTPPDWSGAGESIVEHGTVPPPPGFDNLETVDAVGLESGPAMADGPDFAFGTGVMPITVPSPETTSTEGSGLDSGGPDFAFGTGSVEHATVHTPHELIEIPSPDVSAFTDDTPPDIGSGADSGFETDAADLDGLEPVDAGADAVPDAAPDDGADSDLLS